MKIGLIDIEPKIKNTALMQISYWHKHQGDTVEWAAPLEYDKFDKLYCSSLFTFTNKKQVPERAIVGGTGFDLTTKLPFFIEDGELDYSIYPECKTSYVWFSRGCKRRCPWCVVPEKEGVFYLVRRKQLNLKGRYVTIMDNDFFSNPDWRNVILWLDRIPVDIQGIDARILTEEMCKALDGLRRWKNKQFKIAWDEPSRNLEPTLRQIVRWIKPSKLMCYVLIGYQDTPNVDLWRVETLRKLKIDPFVMPYDKSDPYQKKFARWVNHKAIFKSVKWKDYK